MRALILLFILVVSGFAQAGEAHAQPKNVQLDFSKLQNWSVLRPMPDRVLFRHKTEKRVVMLNEMLSDVPRGEMEQSFGPRLVEDIRATRTDALANKDGLPSNFSGRVINVAHHVVQDVIYQMPFSTDTNSGVAQIEERIWVGEARVWQLTTASYGAFSESASQFDFDFASIVQQISSLDDSRSASVLNLLIPRADAATQSCANKGSVANELAFLSKNLVLIHGSADCSKVKLPASARDSGPPGLKVSADMILGCPGGAVSALQKIGSSLVELTTSTVGAAAAQTLGALKAAGCYTKRVDRSTNVIVGAFQDSWDQTKLETCNRLAFWGMLISTPAQLAIKTVQGAQAIKNYISTQEHPVAAAFAFLGAKIDGFECMTARAQNAAFCAFATHMAVAVATTAVTAGGGAIAFGGATAREAFVIALQAARQAALAPVALAKAAVLAPVTITKTGLKVAAKVSERRAAQVELAAAARTTISPERRGVRELLSPSAIRSRVRQEFVDAYEKRSPVDANTNQDWIDLAGNSHDGTRTGLFFDAENAAIKTLNDDVLKDKSLVTAITNFHKQELLRELRDLKARNPGLEIYPYSDFKSLRYGFRGKIPPNLKEQLDRAFLRANDKFSAELKRLKIVRDADKPEGWFKAGYGETADQASHSARLAREMESPVHAPVVSFLAPETQKVFRANVAVVRESRDSLEANPRIAMILDGSSGVRTPSRDVFELARKAKSPEDLAELLKKRFNLKSFSENDAKAVQSYISSVDRFSASLHTAKRTIVNLDHAEHGGFSVDLLGVGAANQKDLAVALAGAKTSDDVLKVARESERKMTQVIQSRLEAFKKIVGDIAKCSGDDCVGVPLAALSRADKQALLDRVAADPLTREVRMSFVAPKVAKVSDRTLIATSGELIEKSLRSALDGILPVERLRNITFAVDMNSPAFGSGQVGWMAGVNGVPLSSVEKAAVDEALKKALTKVNAGGSKYTSGP